MVAPTSSEKRPTVNVIASIALAPAPPGTGESAMRIHSVEALAVEIPLKKNFGGSTYAVLKRSTVITRMRTDACLVSEVYNGDNREHGHEIVRLIQEQLAPLLRGEHIYEG